MSKASKTVTAVTAIILSMVMSVPALAGNFVDTGILRLVNSDHRISRDYVPDMVQYKNTSFYLNEEAAASLARMLSDMEAELGEAPMVVSTYRSYERQEEVYNRDVNSAVESGVDIADAIKGTSRYVALPGASEHQTALAVDLSNDGSLEEDFIETEAGIWLKENCHNYGFVVRYPEEKEDITQIGYEPWHLRYLGQPFSDILFENDWCLEEFIAYMKRNKYMVWTDDSNIWTITFTQEPGEITDSNTSVSDTNSGGYIVTSRKSKTSLMTVIDNEAKARKDMQLKLYTMMCENTINTLGTMTENDGQAE